MFSDFAAGKPTRVLRDELNSAGFRTSRGSGFTVQTIIPILENQAYIGRCVYNQRTFSKWHRYQEGNSVERYDEGLNADQKTIGSFVTTLGQPWSMPNASSRCSSGGKYQSSQNASSGHSDAERILAHGCSFCGVCGGKMTGHTCTSGKGSRHATTSVVVTRRDTSTSAQSGTRSRPSWWRLTSSD